MPPLDDNPTGRAYWRSLDELADTPAFRQFLEQEFPQVASELAGPTSRRGFLKLMGASLALAGLTACRWPRETIVPYARRPAGRTPGVPVQYATTIELGGVGTGALITSFDGRPVKVEGNDRHPFSLGKSTALMQATLLDMYNPDRSLVPAARGSDGKLYDTSWERFWEPKGRTLFGEWRDSARVNEAGGGVIVLSEASDSPTLGRMRGIFADAFPQSQWFEYEPISRDAEREGTRLAFGRAYRSHMDLGNADVVVSLDDDFLQHHPAAISLAAGFGERRVPNEAGSCRVYVVESTLSLTGSNADYRYPERPGELRWRLVQLLAALVEQGMRLPEPAGALRSALDDLGRSNRPAYVEKMAGDLLQAGGRCVVTVGPRMPAEAHAIGALINRALGAVGKVVGYTEAPDPDRRPHAEAIVAFADLLKTADPQRPVLILGGNPVYDAPAGLELAEQLETRPSVHLSMWRNETSENCLWHLPLKHYLETWSDARAWDGTASIVQPLIDPLADGVSAAELLGQLVGVGVPRGYELTRETFKAEFAGAVGFEKAWSQALHDGVIAGSARARVAPRLASDGWAGILSELQSATGQKADGFEVVFVADAKTYDGRFANNGWLQEMPDPLTKVTWDNAALLAPTDAEALGVRRDDLIEIRLAGRSLRIPACPVPGHPEGVVTLPLGYGREAGGVVADGVGFDTYTLRTVDSWHSGFGASIKVGGGKHRLVTTQDHHAIASAVGDREAQRRVATDLVREASFKEFEAHPKFASHKHIEAKLWDKPEFESQYRWGMAIDLSKCIGCSACVVACQAENNIPVVGKDEVAMGREMQWIRVDRYFSGDPQAPDVRVVHQPMTCHHCETAPCEQVCPVAATVHDDDGLNLMVYNRCIGTRYCNNNCPFKVRRFNWFWNHHGPKHPRGGQKLTEFEKMAFNPEVTVRSRGVMEKCTFCVQRIQAHKIAAKNAGLPIEDGAFTTACAQACPTDAIVFGDLNDEKSRIRRLRNDDRAYTLLGQLKLEPRLSYLAKLRDVDESLLAGGHGHGPGSDHGHDHKHGSNGGQGHGVKDEHAAPASDHGKHGDAE